MSRFTIAIPARNGERFLTAAIESALAQSRQADEVLVIDDNSTDRTAEIAQSSKWNGRVRYRHNPEPTGFADAWNRAAELSTCEFVTILHQDDLLDSDYLRSIEMAVTRFPQAKHFYTACRYIDANDREIRTAPRPHSPEPALLDGKTYARRYLDGVLANQHIHRCPGVTTSRELLTTRCAYRKEAGHIADDDFFYRVGAFTDVVGIPKPLASYREHDQSITGTNKTLELTLAHDWLFQLKCSHTGTSLISGDARQLIASQLIKLLQRALLRALRDRDHRAVQRCSALREQFLHLDRETPRAEPLWAKLLWRSSTLPATTSWLATLYASSLNSLARLRRAHY